MTSLFNDNENIACESCGKVIMREMSFFDWELYCDVVEEVLNDIPRVIYRADGKTLTKAGDVCEILGYSKEVGIKAVQRHVPKRYKLVYSTINPQNKVDKSVHHPDTIFLTNSGVYRLILRSNSEDADLFMDWVTEKVLEGVFEKGYYDLREQHQQAIENMGQEHHLVIEDKDNALTLLNDDLDESHRNIAILEQNNLELQRDNEILKRSYVPYLEDPKKDNSMVVMQKNNGDEYPYIAICGQQEYVAQKIRNKLIDFPNGQIVILAMRERMY